MPSPSELIAKAIAADKTQEARGNKYTFREDHTQWQLDKNSKRGKPSVETYDHIMLEGSEYEKLVLVNGRPLNAKLQKKVDDDMEREREHRKKYGPPSRSVSLGGIYVLDRLFDSKVTGREIVGGRQAWRMESEPKPGVRPTTKEEAQALASRLVLWFDEADGAVARQTNEFIHAAEDYQPGSTSDIVLVKIGEDWVRSDFFIHADLKLALGAHGRVDSQQHFYDYRRFTVDTTFTPQ